VVGDPDQSIYRWRGADLNNILNFEKDYKEAKVIRLEQNYRSVKKVLDGANAVIANNTLRKEKLLWSDQGEGEPLLAASLSTEKEEAKFVVEHFMRQREAGTSYSEMSCFYRTNAQSRPLEEALRIAGIPYIIYGGISFYERAEIKDAMAYLRLFHNPHDSVSAKRIINVPPRGIGKTTIDRVESIAQENQCSFLDAVSCVMGHAKLKSFIDWFRVVELKKQNRTLVQFLTEVLESSGYISGLTQLGTSEAKDRLENLNELVAGVAEFEEGKGADVSLDEKLQEYLERIALISDLDKASDGLGILPLMTLHLAKGLEFKSVAIVGLEEGLLPHSRSQDQLEELEEERRLFYVGMTRAKEKLLLTHAWRRYMHGQEQYSLPSRFLEEIPSELIEKQDKSRRWDSLASPTQEVEYDEFDQRTSEEQEEEQSRYRVGMRVKHPSFGSGIVRRSEKTSLGEKLTVQFDNGDLKKLIADYVTASTR
ncbi:MAG: 3'-5' exonuclease, partial [Deltaproteobacteria bacterium]|nr:3'-5' exonuclease [Deltaproteobacteria bacterium]